MKITKKLITLALAALMLLSLAAPAVAADSDFVIHEDGGIKYLVGYNGPGGHVVVPDGISGFWGSPFSDRTDITGVTLPTSFTFIYFGAFSGCTGLTDITIPTSVIEIHSDVFSGCTGLTDITIPTSVIEIGSGAFSGCTALKSVTIPAGIEYIGDGAFAICPSLTDVYFGGTEAEWERIENGFGRRQPIFDDGAHPTIHYNSDIPDTPTKPAEPVIPGAGEVNGFKIGVQEDGKKYLEGYSGPGGDVVLPDGVPLISSFAFFGCTSFTSVIIPSGYTAVGYCSFNYCSNLKSVSIPASVTYIGPDAFLGCPSLTDVYFEGTQEQLEAIEKESSVGAGNYALFDEGANVTIHYNSTGPAASTTPTTPETPTVAGFADVAEKDYYAEPVKWAVEKEITKGTSTTSFSPEKTCNTAEILTFLWRACDKPEAPAGSFTDVASNAFYADAANWAKSKGMVSGSTLSPETPCTRASAVMFIWQACGSPAASKAASFSDVPANSDYAAAVAWAVEKGVTKGMSATAFSPDEICSRGHIVTFLYRAMA